MKRKDNMLSWNGGGPEFENQIHYHKNKDKTTKDNPMQAVAWGKMTAEAPELTPVGLLGSN